MSTKILLATVNARYAHASLALRYLRANLGELRECTAIREFILGEKTEEWVERLLADFGNARPRILGLGVYIWNVQESTRLLALLKAVAPDVTVIVGGPEVSHEVEQQQICRLADFVVTGWGDVTFAKLARQILHGPAPLMKVHAGEQAQLATLSLPYAEYSDEDLRQRYLYVEASRGCPFKCEFCLSALDKTAWPFPLSPFLGELARLVERGARHIKFVDRTFNLKIETSLAILDFFLARVEHAPGAGPFLHFELIPDHLPAALREKIARFAPGALQFEIGIQTLNPQVQQLQRRRAGQYPLAARTQSRAPACRSDRRPARRGHCVFWCRLRHAGRNAPARDPGRNSQAIARHADRAAHDRVRPALQSRAAVQHSRYRSD